MEAALDVYLLQEVGEAELSTLRERLDDAYELVHYLHPNRKAADGVALLLRRQSLSLERSEAVPFDTVDDQRIDKYMCAAVAFARLRTSGARILLACVHFDAKKAYEPQQTTLDFLESHSSAVDAIVWGGDCEVSYTKSTIPNGYHTTRGGPTRVTPKRAKKLDWIFCSIGTTVTSRNEATEGFMASTREQLSLTGQLPSGHTAEAIVVTLEARDDFLDG